MFSNGVQGSRRASSAARPSPSKKCVCRPAAFTPSMLRAWSTFLSINGGEGAGGRPMMDVTVNIPEVVAEVRALFERYEQQSLRRDSAAARRVACDVEEVLGGE